MQGTRRWTLTLVIDTLGGLSLPLGLRWVVAESLRLGTLGGCVYVKSKTN